MSRSTYQNSNKSLRIVVMLNLAILVSFEVREFCNASSLRPVPSVPLTETTLVAEVPDYPAQIAIGDNAIYVGRQSLTDPVFISRVDLGVGDVSEFGPATNDPDSVVVDELCWFSVGKPEQNTGECVLVAGGLGQAGGKITGMAGNSYVENVFGRSSLIANPGAMVIDDDCNLFLKDQINGTIVRIEKTIVGRIEAKVIARFEMPSGFAGTFWTGLTPLGELAVTNEEGTLLRFYNRFTGELNREVTTNLKPTGGGGFPIGTVSGNGAALVASAGGFWGEHLYSIDDAGHLVTVDLLGNTTVVGKGFEQVADIRFDSDGKDLYVADQVNSRILRISPRRHGSIEARASRAVVSVDPFLGGRYTLYRFRLRMSNQGNSPEKGKKMLKTRFSTARDHAGEIISFVGDGTAQKAEIPLDEEVVSDLDPVGRGGWWLYGLVPNNGSPIDVETEDTPRMSYSLSHFKVSWVSSVHFDYQLQLSSGDLVNWENIGEERRGTGTTDSIEYALGENLAPLFRVVSMPSK